MTRGTRASSLFVVITWLGIIFASSAQGQAPAPPAAAKERNLTTRARGTFDVKLSPQSVADTASNLGRLSIDKTFHGDLEGTSKGEMLSAMTSVKNSAGYVAIERVTGTLNGHRGSFALQHTGTMNRGAPSLSVSVIPDSGTDQLVGLSGTMNIIIDGKSHSYEFDYDLPGKP